MKRLRLDYDKESGMTTDFAIGLIVLMLLLGVPSLFILNHQYSVAHPYVNDVLFEQYGINVRERITIEDACNKIVTNYDTNEEYVVSCKKPDTVLLDINTNEEYVVSCNQPDVRLLDITTKEPIPFNINP